MSPVKNLPFEGSGNDLETNLPAGAKAVLDCLFSRRDHHDPIDGDGDVFQWTWSGLAYAFAERWSETDLEDFVYCLQREIRRRSV